MFRLQSALTALLLSAEILLDCEADQLREGRGGKLSRREIIPAQKLPQRRIVEGNRFSDVRLEDLHDSLENQLAEAADVFDMILFAKDDAVDLERRERVADHLTRQRRIRMDDIERLVFMDALRYHP